ncbi:hypothetical protein, partial [Marinovum sp. PR37]|uniref:hypothetical protein n=1 Tax=Marinovum sp. PR37 TaxID=3028382 RepID=UPI00237C11D2
IVAYVSVRISGGSSVCPNVHQVRDALQAIHDALQSADSSTLDDLSLRSGHCVGTALRWYGARISDLLAAFR